MLSEDSYSNRTSILIHGQSSSYSFNVHPSLSRCLSQVASAKPFCHRWLRLLATAGQSTTTRHPRRHITEVTSNGSRYIRSSPVVANTSETRQKLAMSSTKSPSGSNKNANDNSLPPAARDEHMPAVRKLSSEISFCQLQKILRERNIAITGGTIDLSSKSPRCNRCTFH